MTANAFTTRSALKTEADVEANFIDRLLSRLQYPDEAIKRKHSLTQLSVARGRRKEHYRPDYVLCDRHGGPVAVIEAKSPNEDPIAFHYQVSGYALSINQQHQQQDNPIRYVAVANGLRFVLWPWDSSTPLLDMSFDDFQEDHSTFIHLRSLLAFGALEITHITDAVGFEFKRPQLNKLITTFTVCHDLIWKKDKLGPTDAFYEFSKLIFVKLRQDRRIVNMIASGKTPDPADFHFSVSWIRQQIQHGTLDNPIGLLFDQVRQELEEHIETGTKKRIFSKDERLNLRTETIEEVVFRLEHYNLHGIDEDLNGRMFETFLNATVRGRDLGQFFTPRSVVKYMTRVAPMSIVQDKIPIVLDGCCGSGGFLIEAMAILLGKIDNRSDFTNAQRQKMKKALYINHLYGIDASQKITRIARLNMYLHGDGGSTIFTADTLDKHLRSPSGAPGELRNESSELKGIIGKKSDLFDIVLTNPPFSMKYQRKQPDERRVLDQYQIAIHNGRPSPVERSNVLFLERYYDLMKPGAEMLTVIDNTVLNGASAQRYRDFILERFIVRQVISLPFNTFFPAQANVHTSILHLRKKQGDEEQGHVFMAILNNIGHNDHQLYTPQRDNTERLLELYRTWVTTGEQIEVLENNDDTEENLGCPFQVFVVEQDRLCRKRLDAFYYSLDLDRSRDVMRKSEAEGKIRIVSGMKLNIVQTLTSREVNKLKKAGKQYRYFDIGDVTKAGEIVQWKTNYLDKLPTRARLRVRTNDVVFARNNSSRGTAVIIPQDFDGQLVTTGFLAIRPESPEDALLLWAAFTSEIFRSQLYYLAVTAVQPEVRAEIFRDEMLIPIPVGKYRTEMLNKARDVMKLQQRMRNAVESVRETASHMYSGGSSSKAE